MNKAFIKEPEQGSTAHCPRCGSLGVGVGEQTLRTLLRPEAQSSVSTSAYFCPFPTCDVVYFDAFERTVSISQLVRPVYPKDPTAPICACFGLTCDDIEEDLAENGVRRTRHVVEQARGPEARCERMSASGQSCVGDVQRYYMQRRQARGG